MEDAVIMANHMASIARALSAGVGNSRCLTSIALAGLFFTPGVVADPQALQLKQVKAAFVLNIAKFVTWPKQIYQQRPEQLLLCYYQTDSLGAAFETIRHKTVNGRQLKKVTVEDLTVTSMCDILLIPSDSRVNLADQAPQTEKRPVLIIADMTHHDTDEVYYKGALISLVRQGKRIGFAVDVAETKKVGLRVSSELLKLATIVDSESN